MDPTKVESFEQLELQVGTFKLLHYHSIRRLECKQVHEPCFALFDHLIAASDLKFYNFTKQIVERYPVFSKKHCSWCYFDLIDSLMIDVFNTGLNDDWHKILLELTFETSIEAFKIINDEFFRHHGYTFMSHLTRYEFCRPCKQVFKNETEKIVEAFKQYKPLVAQYDCTFTYPQNFTLLTNCAYVNHASNKTGHYRCSREYRV